MRLLILIIGLMSATNIPMNGQTLVLPLWEDIPFARATDIKERSDTTDIIRISNVISPTIEVFRPSGKVSTDEAVIICPGGGYRILAYDLEGTDIAKMFNAHGITAIVLKYRLPSVELQTEPSITPLADAQQAIRLVRSHAQDWGLNEDKIGIMGFSAGGHLAASLSTMYDDRLVETRINSISARPDFSILVYPVISLTAAFRNQGSREALVGDDSAKALRFSPEMHITAETPPAILIHASNDLGVPVTNSIAYYQALLDKGVTTELHTYDHGGHGFGLASGRGHLASWTDRCIDWIRGLNSDK